MSRERRFTLLALLALSGVAGLWLSLGGTAARGGASASAADTLSSDQRLTLLDNSLQALGDGMRDAPRDRWDPAWVVGHIGQSADSLRKWVGENTYWVPYRGSLRGPVGVLMDRRGNSLDRALLLSELLTRAGHQVRLARTELTASQAEAFLPIVLTVGVTAAEPIPDAQKPVIHEVSARYNTDTAAVMRALAPPLDATERLLTQLEERTTRQASILIDAVPGPDAAVEWIARLDTAIAALREHWWVQVQDGGTWRDLDFVPLDSLLAPLRLPLETSEPAAVNSSRTHEVALSVVVERFAGGALRETRVLEQVLRPAEIGGRRVTLQFWPVSWPSTGHSTTDGGASLRRTALQQQQWRASLVVGDREEAGALIETANDTRGSAASSNPFGAIGNAIAGARPSDAAGDEISAVWLEYEIRVPGRLPRVVRRQVFDLVGPAAREARTMSAMNDSLRLVRSLGFMMRTEILVLGAHLAPEFVVHQFARTTIENKALLRAVATPGFGTDRDRLDSLLGASRADVGPLQTLAVLRQEALGDVAFLDRPVVLTRHRYAAFRDGEVRTADAFDIVANETGISVAEADAFAARLAQGVWDTNLEALLGAREGNASEAFEREGDWSVLDSTAQVGAERLTWNARVRLTRELERGALVVAPDATAGRDAPDAWWRIDPATGDALGIGPLGWGQGVDYGTHLKVILDGAKLMVYAYAECQAIPQAANALNILGEEFWELGLTPSWVTRAPDSKLPEFSVENPKAFKGQVKDFFRGKGAEKLSDKRPTFTGKDFEDVAVENNRKCLLDAIRSGFLATAPILLMHIRAEMMLKRTPRMIPRIRTAPSVTGRRPARGLRGRPPTPRRGPRVANPARGAQGLRKTQDLGATQPNVKTMPIAGQPTMPGIGPSSQPQGPFPKSVAEAERNYRTAFAEASTATSNHMQKTRELVQYRAEIRDGGREFSLDPHHEKLVGESQDTEALAENALAKLKQSEAMVEWSKKNVPYNDPSIAVPPTGGSPTGASVGGSPPPSGASPMAQSLGPAPAPRPVTSLSNALMAIGFAGLTGTK
ncbi:MAG TPA: hypothetical protein VF128_09340 [Gemmatimonadaceae bacterium]